MPTSRSICRVGDSYDSVERVYEEAGRHDGKRFLVERLWPRGIRKANLRVDGWEKDAGPSTELRKWFKHDPNKWEEFQRKYFSELDTRPQAWEPLLKAAEHGTITLLYSSHDTEHNNAVALKRYLETRLTHTSRHSSAHP
ncbi:MAG: DUF488 domain-containing protein [Bryobacteraceae bacterium]